MTASRNRAIGGPGRVRAAAVESLEPGTRALCAFAAAMSRGRDAKAREAIVAARAAGVHRRAAAEAALMLMLYAGYPGALEGLRVLNTTWPGHARRTREGTPAMWRSRGEALCRRVYGAAYGKLVPAVRRLHPDLAVWMVEHGYGRVLARAGLGLAERELVTVAALAALGWERQLVSHVLGAFRVGAGPVATRAALEVGAAGADARGRAVARRTWRRAATPARA